MIAGSSCECSPTPPTNSNFNFVWVYLTILKCACIVKRLESHLLLTLDRTFSPPSYRRRTTVFNAYQRLSTVFEAYHLITHHLTTYDPMSYSLFLLPVFSSCI